MQAFRAQGLTDYAGRSPARAPVGHPRSVRRAESGQSGRGSHKSVTPSTQMTTRGYVSVCPVASRPGRRGRRAQWAAVIAEPALVEKVMRHVEARIARRGWDACPPTLMVMRPSLSAGAPYQPVVIPMDLGKLPKGRGVYGDALLRMASTLIDCDDPARATG